MDFTIRKAEPTDAQAIFGLVERFATSFEPERAAFDLALQNVLTAKDAWLGVADVAGAVIGYALAFEHSTFYANGRVTWVEELMVSEQHRGLGVGRSLMREVEAWARAREAKLVGLATRRAATFYEAIGYEASATYYRRVLR